MKSLRFIIRLLLHVIFAASVASAVSTKVTPNPVIKTLAQGMRLLKPAFSAQAKLQANLLSSGGGVDRDAIAQEVATEISTDRIVIYTYALSPFSTEAISLLEASGYEYEVKELGAEWFLLGPEASMKRVVLSEYDGATSSLPKSLSRGTVLGVALSSVRQWNRVVWTS